MATSDPVGLVRLNIADLDDDNQLLTNEQIQTLLDAVDGNTNRASARALRTIASSEVLIGKKIRTQELSTDGPAVSKELRALAEEFDRHADEDDMLADGVIRLEPFRPTGDRHEAETRRVY